MGTINTVFILGNLGADPELATTKSGHSVCTLRIATNRRPNPDDRSQVETTWHRVKLWRRTADFAHQTLKIGDPIAIEGRIQHEEWQDKEGNPRKTTVIVGQNLTLVGRGRPPERSEHEPKVLN